MTSSENSSPALRLIFSLEIPEALPSWNQILSMEHWARDKFKGELASAFLYALRRTASDSSTKTTCAKSTLLTCAATLERFLAMKQERRKSRRAKLKQSKAKQSEPSSKSSKSFPKERPVTPKPEVPKTDLEIPF